MRGALQRDSDADFEAQESPTLEQLKQVLSTRLIEFPESSTPPLLNHDVWIGLGALPETSAPEPGLIAETDACSNPYELYQIGHYAEALKDCSRPAFRLNVACGVPRIKWRRCRRTL